MKTDTNTPALAIRDLAKTYASGTKALTGVSLDMPQGDFYALLGPNGAGKTTLIGIVSGLVNKSAGSVSVFGYDIDREPERAKSMIGLVPQELNFNIFEKPIDIIVNQAGYYGIPRSIAIPRAEKLLRDLGLYEKRDRRSMELSGGMKRRLMIARALVHEPKLLILDEPTAGVDVELRRGMWDYLRSLTGEGITILLTTHYLEEAEQLCKHVAIIHKGAFAAAGTMREILGSVEKESVILELVQPITKEYVFPGGLDKFKPSRLDDHTITIEIGNGAGLVGDAVVALSERGLTVRHVRQKSGRLEEIFMKLTSAA